MINLIAYISASRIHLFNQCKRSFSFKYLEREPPTTKTADYYASFGSLLHDLYEKLGKAEVTVMEAERLYDLKFPSCELPDDLRPEYYRQGKQSIKKQFEFIQSVNIKGVEAEFNHFLDFSIPPLYGFIDLVYEDENGLVCVDYKSSKPYGKSELDKNFQPIIYALACKTLYGKLPYKFQFRFVRHNETKDILINEKFVKLGEMKIRNVWNRMKNEDMIAEPNRFFCKSFCEHFDICMVGQHKFGGN